MDSTRVLYFLDLLNKETSGHTEELAQLYNRALNEHDDVVRLKAYLDDYNFYREIGGDFKQKGEVLIKEVYSSPDNVLELLSRVKQAHEAIENEVRACNDLMRSPWPFNDIITVLKKKDTIAYMQALRMIASTSVYLVSLYSGFGQLRNLTWNDNVGIQEKINLINTKFLPILCDANISSRTWVIRRKHGGGRTLFGSDFFALSYEDADMVEMECSQYAREPIGTHAYLNVTAFITGETDIPFCWGVGNLVSFSPENALMYLQRNVTDVLRAPGIAELMEPMPSPYECARRLSEGNPFCISPDVLVKAMNQWYMGHDIEERKKTHNCLFCGKHITGNRLVCQSHFTSEMNG